MANASLDVEAELANAAYAALPGFKVYGGELPAGFESAGLPAVRFVALPAQETARAWNGPGLLHQAGVDVDVFDADSDSVADSAAAVRDWVQDWALPNGSAAVTRSPAFVRRPDWNDNVRRRGAVLSLVTR